MAKITFGMIVLNGLPLVDYNLRALYPFAHQIIVVEGAIETAGVLAREDGHSQDGTLERLYAFKAEHDPEDKVLIVTAQDEGYEKYWPEKNEMSQAYAKRATGDWLWQVDSDEFYLETDIQRIDELLDTNPDVTVISFPYYEFWGGFKAFQRGYWFNFIYPGVPRIFRWGKGYVYVEHRPATIHDVHGVNLMDIVHWDYRKMKRENIWMYHYAYVFPKQAKFKVKYYSTVSWTEGFRGSESWLETTFNKIERPFFISEFPNRLQWLVPFRGRHPEIIEKMQSALAAGLLDEPMRPTQDIDKLLANPFYRMFGVIILPGLHVFWHVRALLKPFTNKIRGFLKRGDHA